MYNNTLATVKHQIQQVEKPTPAMVISEEAAPVDNAILLDCLTSEVALEEPDIGRTDPDISIDNNCTDEELHFGMPGASGDYKDAGDKNDECDAIPTASRRQRAGIQLVRFDLVTCGFDRLEGTDCDDADANDEEEASLADDGSMQNEEDRGHSTRQCEDWTWR